MSDKCRTNRAYPYPLPPPLNHIRKLGITRFSSCQAEKVVQVIPNPAYLNASRRQERLPRGVSSKTILPRRNPRRTESKAKTCIRRAQRFP
jgi:hypothetical protein